MSEVGEPLPPDAGGSACVPSPAASAGALLHAAREAAGVHIESLAVALKVPISRLRALEADDYDQLPDAVFARAMAASVCRVLKIDPAPVLALMPAGQVPRLALQTPEGKTAFRDGSEPSRLEPMAQWVRRPLVLGVVLLLAGAALLWLAPQTVRSAMAWLGQQAEALKTAVPAAAPEPAPVLKEAVAPGAPVFAAASSPEPAVAPVAPAVPIPTPLATPASAAAPAAPAAQTPAAPEPAAAQALLALRATSPSWVQVRDASGSTVLQRIVAAAETVVVQGQPPYAVVVGKADATEVYVRGQRFDLSGFTRENVARFEVKP